MLRVGGLFSGLGGIELGLERAGMRAVWHCEADEFCQHVLAQRWPGVPCYPDVRELRASAVERPDVLAGGFPCQDVSNAGLQAGIQVGTRSGLWYEYARLIRELRPRYVIVENVSALLARGFDIVLGDLAACGYDAEWDCIPASAVGAPHRRDRVWLVAYPNGTGPQGHWGEHQLRAPRTQIAVGGRSGDAPSPRAVPDPHEVGRYGRTGQSDLDAGWIEPADGNWWSVEPDVARMAHGVPARVDRVRSLGNAVVPQIAEWIGRRIVAYEAEVTSAQETVLR